jgi:hypothetical protein
VTTLASSRRVESNSAVEGHSPQLELLQSIGWYIVYHPCSWNQLLTSTTTPMRQHSVFMSASPLIAPSRNIGNGGLWYQSERAYPFMFIFDNYDQRSYAERNSDMVHLPLFCRRGREYQICIWNEILKGHMGYIYHERSRGTRSLESIPMIPNISFKFLQLSFPSKAPKTL